MYILGKSPKYQNLNNKFYKKNKLVHEYKNGKYKINFKFTGFDKDPLTSLIIEAKKNIYYKIKKINNINYSKRNYNRYAYSLLFNKDVQKKLLKKKIKFKLLYFSFFLCNNSQFKYFFLYVKLVLTNLDLF